MNERNGRCLCGAVHYRFTGEPVAARICWCRDCQFISANGTANAIVLASAIDVSGELAEFSPTVDSGNQLRRRFCPKCGTHLFANSSARPHFTALRVGTLDNPSSLRPTVNIWASSAPAWSCMDPALDRVEKQPSPPPAPVDVR
jgi:hypothetical protein